MKKIDSFLILVITFISLTTQHTLFSKSQLIEEASGDIIFKTSDTLTQEPDLMLEEQTTRKVSFSSTENIKSSGVINAIEEINVENMNEQDFDDYVLGALFDNIDPDLLNDGDENDEKQVSFWQAIKIFWALPFDIKKQLVANHVKENKKAYLIGTTGIVLGISAIITTIIYYLKSRQSNTKQNQLQREKEKQQ